MSGHNALPHIFKNAEQLDDLGLLIGGVYQ
jgi:hypothetical protein